ncbi:MAG: NUDIX domain-containing protein [Candidatus Diapherotrites archaeon]|nr:NUDIX domain-containing protein [Candidatus Diapherotrites archaeon]
MNTHEEPEMLTVVNELDTVLGKATKDQVLSENLLHRGIGVLVFNLKNELLIHQRPADKKTSPNLWDCFIAGGVRFGETYEKAAMRELEEEIGVNVDRINFLFKELMVLKYSFMLAVFETKISEKIKPSAREVLNPEFIKLSELEKVLKEREFSKKNYMLIPKYLKEFQ